MTDLNRALVADLARLVGKYDPDEWSRLAEWLDDEAHRALLRALLEELAVASHKVRQNARPKEA